MAHNAAIRFEKLKLRDPFSRLPTDLLEDAVFEFALESLNVEEVQFDSTTGLVCVPDDRNAATNVGANSQFFIQFTHQGGRELLTRFDLSSGKLPLQRKRLISASLTDQDFGCAINRSREDSGHNLARRCG